MAQTLPSEPNLFDRDEALEWFRQLHAQIAAANPDLTDKDWDVIAEQVACEMKAGLAQRVRQSRGELDPPAVSDAGTP